MTENLEERLVDFAVSIITVCSYLPQNQIGTDISEKLSHAGIGVASMYSIAQSSETDDAYTEHIKICIHQLRETSIYLKIIIKANLNRERKGVFVQTLNENNALIDICMSTTHTKKE